jgi:hypothetical protein
MQSFDRSGDMRGGVIIESTRRFRAAVTEEA